MSSETISLKLPELSGDFEAGMSSGTVRDPKRKHKLNIMRFFEDVEILPEEPEDSIKRILVKAYTDMLAQQRTDKEIRMVIAKLYISMRTGMIDISGKAEKFGTHDSACIDGYDISVVGEEAPGEANKSISAYFEDENMTVASSVNWWREEHCSGKNNHTLDNFMEESLKQKHGNFAQLTAMQAAKIIGHWCSTKTVFKMAGISNCFIPTPVSDSTDCMDAALAQPKALTRQVASMKAKQHASASGASARE